MASGDPRDPVYGQPYTGTPVLQQVRSGSRTVLDAWRLTSRTVTVSNTDSHYTPDGDLYNE